MGILRLIVTFLISIHVKCCLSNDISHFSIEEITSLFGSKECIEGSLVDFQPPSAMPPTVLAYDDLQAMIKNMGGRMAQQWAPSLSGIYSAFTSTNMTTAGKRAETRTGSTTKSTRSEYTSLDINGKSPMSVVNELSLLTKVRPLYSVLNVQGPPHQRHFTVSLKFGDEEYSASGPSIKKAQHYAANKLLQYTHHQQLLQQMAHKQQIRKKNVGTKTATSQVYEIAAKQKLPITFEVESQTGPPHMPTFATKCVLGNKISRGQGSSKKLSKRAAAEEMLNLLEYNDSHSFVSNSMAGKSRKKRRSSRKKKRTRSLLSTFEQMNPNVWKDETVAEIMNSEFLDLHNDNSKGLNERLARFAKQVVKSGSSFLGEATTKSTFSHKDTASSTSSSKSKTAQDQKVTAKDTLMQAGDLLDFKVQFSDLPKPNNEFLSLVSLATKRPTLCVGVGSTIAASQDQAALRALKALWELDVEQISSNYTPKKNSGWGDWARWSEEMIHNAQDIFHMK